MKISTSVLAVLAAAGMASAQCTVLHDATFNIINDAGNGPIAGSDASRISADSTLFGYGCQGTNSTGAINNSMAAGFDVPAGETWDVSEVTLLVYSTGATTPFLTGVKVDFSATGGAAVVPASARTFTQAHQVSTTDPLQGVYRMTNTGGDANRRIVEAKVAISPAVSLGEGHYYMSWNYDASGVSSGPWQPHSQEAGNIFTAPAGDTLQSIGGAAFAIPGTVLSSGMPAALPFIICGSMGSGCYADCDGNGTLNVFDYICFGNAYSSSAAYADCDGNGSFNVFDYICFGNAYAAGCP